MYYHHVSLSPNYVLFFQIVRLLLVLYCDTYLVTYPHAAPSPNYLSTPDDVKEAHQERTRPTPG